jgi:hypothetical protein
MVTDAMSISWKHLGREYVCPPWNLLPSVIQKIQLERIPTTLITPSWLSAIWSENDSPTSSTAHSTTPSPARSHSVAKRPLRESTLVAVCLEYSLRCLELSGLNGEAVDFVMRANPMRYLGYAQTQAAYTQ